MAVKKKYDRSVLGRGLDNIGSGRGLGLDALINTNDIRTKGTANLLMLPIDKIEPNPDQPRHEFDESALKELAVSIREIGVIVPITVREMDGEHYQIIAGERRWRAAKKAGLKKVPVIIRDLSEQEIMEISLIENIQREDLNPIEEALAYKKLLEEFNLKQDEVAEKVSKSRAAITNSLRLLKLDERVQQMLIEEMITPGHARAILNIEDPEQQYEFAQKIFDEKMSVRDVEKEIKRMNSKKPAKEKPGEEELEKDYVDHMKTVEEQLKQKTGTKVLITPKTKQSGKIEIDYFSNEEFEKIVACFNEIH